MALPPINMIAVQFATVDLAIAAEEALAKARGAYDNGLTCARRSCGLRFSTPTTKSSLALMAVLNGFVLAKAKEG